MRTTVLTAVVCMTVAAASLFSSASTKESSLVSATEDDSGLRGSVECNWANDTFLSTLHAFIVSSEERFETFERQDKGKWDGVDAQYKRVNDAIQAGQRLLASLGVDYCCTGASCEHAHMDAGKGAALSAEAVAALEHDKEKHANCAVYSEHQQKVASEQSTLVRLEDEAHEFSSQRTFLQKQIEMAMTRFATALRARGCDAPLVHSHTHGDNPSCNVETLTEAEDEVFTSSRLRTEEMEKIKRLSDQHYTIADELHSRKIVFDKKMRKMDCDVRPLAACAEATAAEDTVVREMGHALNATVLDLASAKANLKALEAELEVAHNQINETRSVLSGNGCLNVDHGLVHQ